MASHGFAETKATTGEDQLSSGTIPATAALQRELSKSPDGAWNGVHRPVSPPSYVTQVARSSRSPQSGQQSVSPFTHASL